MECTVENCNRKQEYISKGWCAYHYKRMWEYGTFEFTRIVGNDEERFWSKVSKTKGCWLWEGPTNPEGYGRFYLNHKLVGPHRYSYELHNGKIPKATPYLDHLCRNPLCVNPDHLEPVTNRENGVRGVHVTGKKSGLPVGVSRRGEKFRATIMIDGKSRRLGTFHTPQEAHQAYLETVPCH